MTNIAKDFNVTTTVLFTLRIVALLTTGAKYCHAFTVNSQLKRYLGLRRISIIFVNVTVSHIFSSFYLILRLTPFLDPFPLPSLMSSGFMSWRLCPRCLLYFHSWSPATLTHTCFSFFAPIMFSASSFCPLLLTVFNLSFLASKGLGIHCEENQILCYLFLTIDTSF